MVVVFDMDDTLFRERDFVASGKLAVRDALYPDLPIGEMDKTAWGDAERAIYRSHFPDISLTEDARQALELLSMAHVPMAIITDGRTLTQTNKYRALGLDRYIPIDHLFISEAVGHDKHDPDSFRLVMERYLDDTYYYIGDNPAKDFYWPNQLGWTTVMLKWDDGQCVHPQSLDTIPPLYHPQYTIICGGDTASQQQG